jgi:hypothetical protein
MASTLLRAVASLPRTSARIAAPSTYGFTASTASTREHSNPKHNVRHISLTHLPGPFHTTPIPLATLNPSSPANAEPSASKPTPSSPKTSDSAGENEVKSSRANEAAGKSGTGGNSASVAKPVTPGQGGVEGADEEGANPVLDQDKDKSAEEKRRRTEEVGQRKLDPAD